MRGLHFIIGVLVLVIFLFSGYYMVDFVPDLPAAERMTWRANHIYLLMMAIGHLLLGGYYRDTRLDYTRAMQTVGSIFMFAGSLLAILAFFLEAGSTDLDGRIYSFAAALCIFSGTILHSLSTLIDSHKAKVKS